MFLKSRIIGNLAVIRVARLQHRPHLAQLMRRHRVCLREGSPRPEALVDRQFGLMVDRIVGRVGGPEKPLSGK